MSCSTVQGHISAISSKLDRYWHLSTDNFFSLFLDDLLTCFGVNGGKHYRPLEPSEREQLFELGQMYARAVVDCPYEDLLGQIYMDLAGRGHKKALGQFFTPNSVCRMMAEMSNYDMIHGDAFADQNVIRVAEPTCGSGAMVLGMLHCIREKKPALLEQLDFTLIDIDRTCIRMAAIQILTNLLIHGDTLAGLRVYRGNALGPTSELEWFIGFQNYQDDVTDKAAPVQPDRFVTLEKNLDMFELAS
jgi:hypothetical protein